MSTTITSLKQLDLNGVYTYADYLLWKIKERVELFRGKIFEMSPAPNRKHQYVSMQLTKKILFFFEGKKCQLYSAPFDVRLPKKGKNDEDILTVVQPDLCVICDETKLDERGCIGAPDLVIEILSPGNSKKEINQKFDLYEESGIREYWIVDPIHESVQINVLENGAYTPKRAIADEYVTSYIFPNLKIHTDDIFR